MSELSFNASFKEAVKCLKKLGLLKSEGVKIINRDDVSPSFKNASQKDDYFNLYKVALTNFDYDILLKDDSILQFSYKFSGTNPPSIRYAYFQNPRNYKTYKDFLEVLKADGIIDDLEDDLVDIFDEEYQQFLTEQEVNETAISIRFDVDPMTYKPLVHSAAHFHIGHKNNVRIPSKIILTPLKFSIFIVKHVYYNIWKDHIDQPSSSLKTLLNSSKESCLPLDSLFWDQINEQKEMYIS